jgi:hypothetical protein
VQNKNEKKLFAKHIKQVGAKRQARKCVGRAH